MAIDDIKPTDNTYSAMPPPGTEDAGKLGHVSEIGRRFRLEAGTARNRHIGSDSRNLNESENLYRFGHERTTYLDENGKSARRRPTVNRVKKTLDSFVSNSNRTPASITLKSASVNEEGTWVMKKPFVFIAPTDPQTGQPQIDPATGQPYQNITLNVNDPVPDDIVDFVPSHRRIHINTETVVKWEQATFDVIRREIDFNDTVRQMVDYKQKCGWLPVLFEWDPIINRPEFSFYPLQQWYLDPIQTDVSKMNRVGLDMIVDAARAVRLYPKAKEQIMKSAVRSVKFAPGSIGYSPVYLGDTAFATPIVTLAFMWLRNIEVHMNLKDALDSGIVTKEGGETESNDEDTGDDGGDETDTGAADEAASVDEEPAKIVLAGTDHDLTNSFDDEGNPSTTPHAQHPRHLVTVQWIQIDTKVVPGTYIKCPHYDIPVVLDKNSEIMWTPFGDPDTIYLKGPQYVINSMYEAMTDHAEWFKGPTSLMARELADGAIDKDFVNGFAKPGKVYTFDHTAIGDNVKISDVYQQIQPPPMTQALPLLLEHITKDYERIADAGVNNGTPPPGVTAASAIANLQSLSQSTNDLKSMHTEKAISRAVKLWLHAQVNWMSLDAIMKINRSIPREIVETWIMPFRKEIVWDAEVGIATGNGAVEQQRKAQIRADVQIGIVDKETARDELDYDSAEIERRETEQMEREAKVQAEAQAKAAPPQQSGPPAPNISISVGYQYLQPEAQSGVLQLMGLPPLTQPFTADHAIAAAKVQNEANRTAVDAHSKIHQMAMNENAAKQQAAQQQQPQPAGA